MNFHEAEQRAVSETCCGASGAIVSVIYNGLDEAVTGLTGEEAYFKNYEQCILVVEHVS